MTDVARRDLRRGGRGGLPARLPLEIAHLFLGQNMEERFEQDNGLAQAGVQVVMQRVQGKPGLTGVNRRSVPHFFQRRAKIFLQILDHLPKNVNLMEELGTLGEENPAKQ